MPAPRQRIRPADKAKRSGASIPVVPAKERLLKSSNGSSLPGPHAGPKYFFSTDIPDHYNETYMRAMPRDPVWIFAYWEISQDSIGGLKVSMGDGFAGARWVLRVSDVTGIDYNGENAWRTMDIDISFNASSWYIKVWEPGRDYLIQGGLLTRDLAFFEAVRSNAIRMPRAGVSTITDAEWSMAGSNALLMMYAAGSMKSSIGASERLSESELGAGPGQGSGSGAIL